MSFKIYSMRQQGRRLRMAVGENPYSEYNEVKALVFDQWNPQYNVKTQDEYTKLTDQIINATNEKDGQRMVLYTDGKNLYVREMDEFSEKFI